MLHSKRVCIFIDGENLRHSIGYLFPNFNRSDYLPKADWQKFFDWIVTQAAGSEADRIRSYWYVVQNVDFSPYNINSLRFDNNFYALLNVLNKDAECNRLIKNEATQEKKEALMTRIADDLLAEQSRIQNRFNGWLTLQNLIAGLHNSIEFRRAGAIRYDLFKREFGSEKAVDVKLATDLIMLKDIYDIAIIVSGDQDYVPAVQAIKDMGKRVVNVSFLTEKGRLLPGGARRLNQSTDWNLEISHSDTKTHLGF